MSATSYYIQETLCLRSQHVKPGVKKLVKSNLSRVQRQRAKRQLTGEVQALVTPESLRLHDLTCNELEAYADALLLASRPEDECYDESFDAVADYELERALEVPSLLMGALPDWMIRQLEEANGDAFAVLSLFEAKSPSPKAAISMVDEPLYA
jgi:hypothetical protein